MSEFQQSRGEYIADRLRDDIIGGLLAPGKPLIEADLVTRYETSRNTLREALHQLDREGLARYVRNKGVFVRRLGADSVRDIYRVRRVIEMQAIRESRTFGDMQLEQMLSHAEAAETALERENWRQVGTHSLLFHRSLVATLGSPLLDQFFMTVLAQLRLVFALDPDEERFQTPWVARDRQLLELLDAGRHEAAHDALGCYLDDSEQSLLNLLHDRR